MSISLCSLTIVQIVNFPSKLSLFHDICQNFKIPWIFRDWKTCCYFSGAVGTLQKLVKHFNKPRFSMNISYSPFVSSFLWLSIPCKTLESLGTTPKDICFTNKNWIVTSQEFLLFRIIPATVIKCAGAICKHTSAHCTLAMKPLVL